MVFDGLIPHVAGGKHGEFNHRFAQPGSQASRSPNNLFPFSDAVQTDPETGHTDGLLRRLSDAHHVPKVMHTYTSSEYWAGHGALVHIDVTGRHDLEVPEAVRIYHFGGTQHGLGGPPLKDTDPGTGIRGQQPFNWTDYRPLLRAALVNLDRWVTHGELPPPSRYPRLDDGTAVPPGQVLATFDKFPGVNHPEPLRRFFRFGQILASGGASGGTLLGATIPFAATREARQATADPRPSIVERYGSKDSYLARVKQAAQALVDTHYLLAEDVTEILDQASQHYDLLVGQGA
jgi:hypothetical protein